MTHGAISRRKHVFYNLRGHIRLPFIAICLVVLLLFLLSASYYSSFELPLIGEFQPIHYGAFRNTCSEHTTNYRTITKKPQIKDIRNVSVTYMRLYKNATKTRLNSTGFEWNDTRLDILSMKLPPFDKRFKNPCWYEPLDRPNPYEENAFTTYSSTARNVLNGLASELEDKFFEDESPVRLRCLPYFLMIGQPKCGSTDLFWKIAKHGDILPPPIKELHWWSRNRQGRRFSYKKLIPFDDYVDMFDEAALTIEELAFGLSDKSSVILSKSKQPITGEASVSLFWDNSDWEKFPENRNQAEPTYIIPHYIHHIIPNVKLILMFRDPVERLYSDYLYFNSQNKSADDFHGAVSDAVEVYTNCSLSHSLRSCVYNLSVANRARVRLRVGLYSVYLKDWLRVFPLKQFYILRLEDYSQDQLEYIRKIHKFLGLREVREAEAAEITEHPNYNSRKKSDRVLGGMHDKTREMLQKFYGPFNRELASILKDKRFLWDDTDREKTSTTTVASTTLEML